MTERTLGHKLYEAVGWLDMCQDYVIFGAFSGGNDSVVACDILHRWCKRSDREFRVMCIETGLQADSWKSDVTAFCESQWHTTPEFFTGQGFNWYRENVLGYGFGYTPRHHSIYYRSLKERAIDAAIRHNKRYSRDRVAFVTGVRRAESRRRSNTPYYNRKHARVSLNLICEFTEDDVQRYIKALLPSHDVKRRSRDCYCNWTRKETVQTLQAHSPLLAEKIARLERDAVAAGFWPYGGHPDDMHDQAHEAMPEDSWCISCQVAS